MLTVTLLLLIPLGLRYLASWHMARLRLRLLHGDDEIRALQSRCTGIREDLIQTRRQLRQYQVRKDFLGNDIRRERLLLEELRGRTGAERLAA